MAISLLKQCDLTESTPDAWTRIKCPVIHRHEDGIDVFRDSFIDVQSNRVRIWIPGPKQWTTVIDARISTSQLLWFPRVRSLAACLFQYPFPIALDNISVNGRWVRFKIPGYFDSTFSLRLASDASWTVKQLRSAG